MHVYATSWRRLSSVKDLAGKQFLFGVMSHIDDFLVNDIHVISLISFINDYYVDGRVHHISDAESIRLKVTRVPDIYS